MTTLSIDECRGCNIVNLCVATKVEKVKVDNCPCRICIVKTVCLEVCEPYSEWRTKLPQHGIIEEDMLS